MTDCITLSICSQIYHPRRLSRRQEICEKVNDITQQYGWGNNEQNDRKNSEKDIYLTGAEIKWIYKKIAKATGTCHSSLIWPNTWQPKLLSLPIFSYRYFSTIFYVESEKHPAYVALTALRRRTQQSMSYSIELHRRNRGQKHAHKPWQLEGLFRR